MSTGVGEPVGLAYVFYQMTDEYRAKVVTCALTERESLQRGIRAAFDAALDATPIRVNGFARPSKAHPRQLAKDSAKVAMRDDGLAAGILRSWVELHEPLREHVGTFMRENGLGDDEPDYSGRTIQLVPFDESRTDALERFATSDGRYTRDDVLLMSYYVLGQMPAIQDESDARSDDDDSVGPSVDDEPVVPVVGHERTKQDTQDENVAGHDSGSVTPANGDAEPEAETARDEPTTVASDDGPRADAVDDAPATVVDEQESDAPDDARQFPPSFEAFLDGLRGLPDDAPEWRQDGGRFAAAIDAVREERLAGSRAIADLEAALIALSDEHAALLTFFEWNPGDALPADPRTWEDVHRTRSLVREAAEFLTVYAEVSPVARVLREEAQRRLRRAELEVKITNLLAVLETLATATPSVGQEPDTAVRDEPEDGSPESTSTEDHTAAELTSARAENERLSKSVADLTGENKTLTDSLVAESSLSEMWRRSYVSAQRSPSANTDELPEFQNVDHVLQEAKGRLAPQLSFTLNSRSDTTIPFDHLNQVWDALNWLATTYHQAKSGANGPLDLGLSLRETCGWSYTPNQSDTTIGRFREYYETTVAGRKHRLREHVRKGNGYDRGTIRIAFFWHAAEQKVVIGYVGRHQKTGAS